MMIQRTERITRRRSWSLWFDGDCISVRCIFASERVFMVVFFLFSLYMEYGNIHDARVMGVGIGFLGWSKVRWIRIRVFNRKVEFVLNRMELL
jgi:hypothetical protein